MRIHIKSTSIIIIIVLMCTFTIKAQTTKASKDSLKQVFINKKWQPFILGDINNDNIIDTAFVYTPGYYATPDLEFPKEPLFDSCINNNCFNKVRFSCNLPEIYIKNTLWGKVEMIDDLDGDGIKEIVFQTDWIIGTHVTIYIYSYNKAKKKWQILAKNWLYGEDSYKHRIKKINKDKFRFRVEYMDDKILHDISNKNIIVKIKK